MWFRTRVIQPYRLPSCGVKTHDDQPAGDPAAHNLGEPTQAISIPESRSFDDLEPEREPARWHGGADLGLLILRLTLGGIFVAHGAQKMFGVFGGPGTDGFAQSLQKFGYERTGVLSLVAGATELGAGALLILGLLTPLAAAGVLGVMLNAIALKLGQGFFATTGGFEYEVVLGALAIGLMFTGPGRASVDNGRWWYRRPLASGLICLLLACGAAAVTFFVLRTG